MSEVGRFVVDFLIDGKPYASRTLTHLPSVGHEILLKNLSKIPLVVAKVCWVLAPEDHYHIKVNIYLTRKKLSP